MMEKLIKTEIDSTLENIEYQVFGQKVVNSFSSLPISYRIEVLFANLYLHDLHPEGIELIKQSYRLLQSKGYYYTDE